MVVSLMSACRGRNIESIDSRRMPVLPRHRCTANSACRTPFATMSVTAWGCWSRSAGAIDGTSSLTVDTCAFSDWNSAGH